MSRQRASMISSTSRPLAIRVRPDLIIESQRYLGREYWIVKDPLTLKYYRFEEQEYFLLQLLDGRHSLDEIQRQFGRRFAPERITRNELHRFIGMLYRSSLLLSDAGGQGAQLQKRASESKLRSRRAAMSNLLAIRFRGINPDRLLASLNRACGWVFSVPALAISCALMLAALLLITVQFETFQQRLPSFHEFFAARNWLWLAITLAFTKVLHELGHGLACKRLGGECHEMGLMFLVFTPCLYCNVSDAWMLPNKWQRAAVAAAGIYTELLLASICTFIWWFTHPGLLHYLCLNVMFVSSVSTVLFNANPLLRYDGYYILSDLLEIPNLRQKAQSLLRRKLGWMVAGLSEPHDPFLPHRHRWLFVTYALLSAVYRWVIVFSIFWFVYSMLEPYGLKLIGQCLALAALYSLVVLPVLQLVRFFRVPGRISKVKPWRVAISGVGLAAIVGGILAIPLPYFVTCPVFVQPRSAASVYVESEGQLVEIHVEAGQQLNAGDPILTLNNGDVAEEIIKLAGDLAIEEARLRNARLVAAHDPSQYDQVRQLEQSTKTLEDQLNRRWELHEKLVLRAPSDGTVFPADYRGRQQDRDKVLETWYGSPLQTRNLGAYLRSGTVVCRVGDAGAYEAVLAVDQEKIESIRAGQPVQIRFTQARTVNTQAVVEEISTEKMTTVPAAIAAENGGSLATTNDSSGLRVPQNPTYQVSCSVDLPAEVIPQGATGIARIRTGKRTVGRRLWDWACRTVKLEL